MAPRRRFRKRRPQLSRRRRVTRYRKRRNPRYRITTYTSKLPTGLPDNYNVKLKYTEFHFLTTSVQSDIYFRGNSIYDPYAGVGGLQPLGYDQWEIFYGKYLVNASKISLQIMNNATTGATGNIVLNLCPSDTNVSRTYSEWNGYPYNKSKFITPVSSGQNGIYMSNYMTTRKILGDKTMDDVHEAYFGFNPGKEWYWTLAATNISGGSISLDVKVTITYYVTLKRRQEILTSS